MACRRAKLTTRLVAPDTAIPQLRAKCPDDREFWKALSDKMDFAAECAGSSDIEWDNMGSKAALALPSITRADRPPSVRCLVISVIQYFAASFAFHSLPSPLLPVPKPRSADGGGVRAGCQVAQRPRSTSLLGTPAHHPRDKSTNAPVIRELFNKLALAQVEST